MSQKRRTDDDDAAGGALLESPSVSNSKPRKETNASARRSLFVRSLPATATSSAITELFSESYPLKHATVVIDPETKQSKGYGFVTFADAEDAQRAMDEFNGKPFQGRKMKIEIAEPRSRDVDPSKAKPGAGRPKSALAIEAAATKKERQDKMAETKKPPKLIIRNLPWSIKTPEQLEELFQKFGKVKHSTLPKVKDTQAGFGFIVMRGRKNAEKAMATINGTLVDGRTIAVDWAVDKDVWEGQKSKDEAEDAEKPSKAEAEEEEDLGPSVRRMPSEDPEDSDADLENFFKNFGDALESEDEEAGEEVDFEDDEEDAEAEEDAMDAELGPKDESDEEEDEDEDDEDIESEEDNKEDKTKNFITDNSSTLFVRNVAFTVMDAELKEHFMQFGPVRYARVVMDRATERPKGTGFVCFFNVEDADNCYRNAPKHQPSGANAIKADGASKFKHSVLQDEDADIGGLYTLQGRVLQISKAVEKEKAIKLTEDGTNFRTGRDQDKRRLYLLSEGTVSQGTSLYAALAPSEIKMREDSATQRKKLIQNNPTLHLSLTRLSIRNMPKNVNSKDLKALAREAVVGFASDVRIGARTQLSKEEEARGGEESRLAEQQRKAKGKGIVRQAKIVFEGREGAKVSEDSGAGKSRGYGFVEYSSHRWALMGLRWLNGHALESGGKKQRLIVEFAIENAQVVARRKEKEEKARLRSKEVLAEREKAEKEGKNAKGEKKTLTKDQLMRKTRVGMKGKKGPPAGAAGRGGRGDGGKGKPFQKGPHVGEKRKREDGEDNKGGKDKSGKPEEKKFKPGFPPGEEGRLARRNQIIAKKRQMRNMRKKN